MPALPFVPNVLKAVETYAIGSNGSAATVTHWQYSGSAPTAANLAGFAADWQAQVSAQLKFLMNDNNQWTGITLTDLASSSGKQGSNTTPVTGTLTGALLPGSTALLMNHQVGTRYRGGKPRTYFPWGDEGKQAGSSLWASGFTSLCSTNYAAAVTAFTGATAGSTTIVGPCAVSYYSGFTVEISPSTGRARNVPKLRAGGPVVYPIITSTPRAQYATIRRRNN